MSKRRQFIKVTYKYFLLIAVIILIVAPVSAQQIKEIKIENQINKCKGYLPNAYMIDQRDQIHISKIKFKANLLLQTALEQTNDLLNTVRF